MAEQKPTQNMFARAGLVAGGFFYTLSGVTLFFAQQWFYNNVGTYPPFNRHYEGDLGTLLMPMGIASLSLRAIRRSTVCCLESPSRAAFYMRSITCWMNWCYRLRPATVDRQHSPRHLRGDSGGSILGWNGPTHRQLKGQKCIGSAS